MALVGAAVYFMFTTQVTAGDRASVFGNIAMAAVCLMMAARVLWCQVKVTDAGIVVHGLLGRPLLGWHLIRAIDAGHRDMSGALISGQTVIVTLCNASTIALWWATTGRPAPTHAPVT